MRSDVPGSKAAAAAAVLLLAALLLQAWSSIRLKSPTFDEPAHIAAGMSYLTTGDFRLNLQHPPLLKEIAAAPLLLAGVRWPVSPQEWSRVGSDPEPSLQWEIGREVLYQNDTSEVLFWSRLPCLLLTLLLGWALYAWGRDMLGPFPAAVALGLLAFDPSIVAHGILVATDTGFALFATLFFWALWCYLRHRAPSRLVVCGLALGGALGAKFTGVLLLPILLVMMLWAAHAVPASGERRRSSLVDPYAGDAIGARAAWAVSASIAMAAIAFVVVELFYGWPRDPFLYVRGIARVNADHDPRYWPYMAGTFQPRFWSYYALAYLLKEPIPSILLAALGAVVALARRGSVGVLDRAFLVLPPAALFIFYTLVSHNLGFRYIIPALPFLYLFGGIGARSLWRSGSAWKRGLLAALGLWLGVTAVGIYPDHLSYFNESACLFSEPSLIGLDGGTACGPRWLDDSNVDWGQGLNQLKSWMDRNAPGRPIGLAYFGTALPERHGLVFDRLTGADVEAGLPPGLNAVSAHLLARAMGRLDAEFGDRPGNWIRRVKPVAVVGHAFYLYDIPPPALPSR